MNYKYYYETELEEHMLNAKELALKFKVYTHTDNLANSFMINLIADITKDIEGYNQLFYYTNKGLMKVYPQSLHEAINDRLKDLEENKFYTLSVNGKNFKIRRF